MSTIQERLQLKRVPLDTWNVREQLCLASAVVRSGDQNWMSVSRALKTVGEPNRPTDWYSQKSCAAQYGALLEHVETPKRKKRSSEGAGETPQESILKRLTQERINEIQKNVTEMTQQYEQLKNEIMEARNPTTSDDRIRDMWAAVEAAKRARERDSARRAAWLRERDERRNWRPPASPGTPATPSSPLLTSLLKSSPVVTTPQHMPHPASVVDSVSPSAGAPTLSMLLDKSATPATSSDKQSENKHAAIEHIKSQLVQIEQQLKAGTTTPPPLVVVGGPPPAAPAPALDIDDIEIKAEDVYAFRDIDIHIPPVTTMHKGANRMAEKIFKKDDTDLPAVVDLDNREDHVEIKEEPMLLEAVVEQTATQDDLPPQEPEVPDAEPLPPPESTAEPETVKIAFPEVKFPTTEIKVIQPDDVKTKEELKEVEVTPVEAPEQFVEVAKEDLDPVRDVPLQDEQLDLPPIETIPEVVQPPDVKDEAVQPPTEPVDVPEDIPLPPEPEPKVEVADEEVSAPLEPQPSAESEDNASVEATEDAPQEVRSTEQNEPVVEVPALEETAKDDIKKENEVNDSMPLKELSKEEVAVEVKEEPQLEEPHTETDDDTPMELSREEEKDGKKKRDYSRKKKPDSRTCSGSESAAEASAPESPSANDAERQHRLWKKSVMLVYSRLCAHKYASLFLRPITDEEAPGYSVVVKRPMDLSAIRRNIESGVIRTTAEFQRDVLLMLSNALMYNSSEHSVYSMAQQMHEEAQSQLCMLLAAQAHAGLVAAPPARRKRRRDDTPRPNKRLHH